MRICYILLAFLINKGYVALAKNETIHRLMPCQETLPPDHARVHWSVPIPGWSQNTGAVRNLSSWQFFIRERADILTIFGKSDCRMSSSPSLAQERWTLRLLSVHMAFFGICDKQRKHFDHEAEHQLNGSINLFTNFHFTNKSETLLEKFTFGCDVHKPRNQRCGVERTRTPKNTRSRSRIFSSDSGSPIGSYFTSHS